MWSSLPALLGVVATATILAAILRRAGLPGSAIVGGVLAGVLCGPGILGRIAPDPFERWFEGSAETREQLVRHERRMEADREAARAVGIEVGSIEGRGDLDAERSRLALAVEQEGWTHRATERGLVATLAVIVLLAGIAEGAQGARRIRPDQRGELASLGAWSALVPAALASLLLAQPIEGALDRSSWSALLAAAAALAVGPWCLSRMDADGAESSEPGGADLVRGAGLLATIIGIALLVAAAALAGMSGDFAAMAVAVVAVGAATGSIGRAAPLVTLLGRVGLGVVPGIVALAMLRLEPWLHAKPWPILVALLLVADGRYLGALVAAALPGGRRGLRSMRLVLASTAVGPMQAAIAAVAVEWELVPHAWGLALLVAAMVPEVTAPLRRRFSEHLRIAEVLAERGRGSG